ncbi:MAG: dienelactone hydrolase family protein [Alphaproteobacteria bacterium]|nr:dienelactone hydrolase family protein [Alphaproteobacteria bacterium]
MALRRRIPALGLLTAMAVALGARAETTQDRIGVNHNMVATTIAPDGPGPYPAVLVLHTSSGLGHDEFAFAQHLVAAGYVTLLPAFIPRLLCYAFEASLIAGDPLASGAVML